MTPLEAQHASLDELRLWLDECRSHRVDPAEAGPASEYRHDGIAYGSTMDEATFAYPCGSVVVAHRVAGEAPLSDRPLAVPRCPCGIDSIGHLPAPREA